MTAKIPAIRLLTAVLASITACAFVSAFDFVSRWVIGFSTPLPALTDIAVRYSGFAYALPTIVLLAGIIFIRQGERGGVGFECVVSTAWLFALLWILFAICVWQLPRIEIVDHIR